MLEVDHRFFGLREENKMVVVISEGQSADLLTQMNAVMRRIDLSCKLLAPVAVGFIMSYISVTASAIFLVLWNILSIGLEYWLLSSVYYAVPTLNLKTRRDRSKEKPSSEEPPDRDASTIHLAGKEENVLVKDKLEMISWQRKLLQRCLHIPTVEAWVVYIQQDVMLAGLALAMLYFTFWYIDDSNLGMARYPLICAGPSSWSKCSYWDSCNTSLSHSTLSSSITPHGTLVHLDSDSSPCNHLLAKARQYPMVQAHKNTKADLTIPLSTWYPAPHEEMGIPPFCPQWSPFPIGMVAYTSSEMLSSNTKFAGNQDKKGKYYNT
eukprot:Gb_09599 [translate_table: standard]